MYVTCMGQNHDDQNTSTKMGQLGTLNLIQCRLYLKKNIGFLVIKPTRIKTTYLNVFL